MVLQSHNSWSYLKPKKWWMKLLKFTAKCQKYNIVEQYYKYNVRSFDLRIRFDENGNFVLAHGHIEYSYTIDDVYRDLSLLNALGSCSVRILHETRNKKQYSDKSLKLFKKFCGHAEMAFKNIEFYSGKNLYNWDTDYTFNYVPSEISVYSSVCLPKVIDDWYPWLFAKIHNKKTFKKYEKSDFDILSIDFVNIR